MSDTPDPPSTTDGPPPDQIPVTIEEEMRRSYLDYAMSVIVSRALPDARDGLKPVHRRILFGMREGGYTPDRPYRKSAKIIGDVMGNYHPHGNLAIYDALVRLAQPFSMRTPLIDGQGNFGSVDGDPPAAERYTEARLARAAMHLLADIDRDTVDFQPNYDETREEPRVLPAAYPNLLINGGSGIAVGMATNIPPHNPGEILDATLALIAEPELDTEALMRIVPGPDFPTGGIIVGRTGIRQAFETGRGSIVLRARCEFEEIRKDRQAIIVTELPFQVNKANLLERIAELVRAKQIEGIGDLRDESDRSGMRMVIELRRDATPEVVLNQLFRFTSLQIGFGMNMVALDEGRPRLFGLKDSLATFIRFREEVILRRARHDLLEARKRAHLLVGLAIAVASIDEVIALIRASADPAAARAALVARAWPVAEVRPLLALVDDERNVVEGDTVRLTDDQARGILDLTLRRLTGLEREKILAEMTEVASTISELLAIIASRPRRLEVMVEELTKIRADLATPRLTSIVDGAADQDDESLIEPGQMVVTLTREGFIKRMPLDAFRQQNRGGKGRSASSVRGDDVVTRSFFAHTHQWVLFFSASGRVFREKVWRLPEAQPGTRGRALINLLPELGTDTVTAVLPLPQDEQMWDSLHLVFATAHGGVRRNKLSDFRNVRAAGLIAMKLEAEEGTAPDRLVGVATCRAGDDVFLATRLGRCIRFQIEDSSLRVFAGRESSGVRGIRLGAGDEVISMSVLPHRPEGEDATGPDAGVLLLTVTDSGFGKRSPAAQYRVTGRGGQGVTNITLTPRTGGAVVGTLPLGSDQDIMLVTSAGRLIRVPADQVRVTGRTAMGVTLFRLDAGERVTSVFPVIEQVADAEPPASDVP